MLALRASASALAPSSRTGQRARLKLDMVWLLCSTAATAAVACIMPGRQDKPRRRAAAPFSNAWINNSACEPAGQLQLPSDGTDGGSSMSPTPGTSGAMLASTAAHPRQDLVA
jgi:hypothetical protein